MPTKTEIIRTLNNHCRQSFTGCKLVTTAGVRALEPQQMAQLLEGVRTFDAFTEDNDPHGEHDFGDIALFDATWFWKIDCYTPDLEGGSDDPSDPDKICRVLTVLRADEY